MSTRVMSRRTSHRDSCRSGRPPSARLSGRSRWVGQTLRDDSVLSIMAGGEQVLGNTAQRLSILILVACPEESEADCVTISRRISGSGRTNSAVTGSLPMGRQGAMQKTRKHGRLDIPTERKLVLPSQKSTARPRDLAENSDTAADLVRKHVALVRGTRSRPLGHSHRILREGTADLSIVELRLHGSVRAVCSPRLGRSCNSRNALRGGRRPLDLAAMFRLAARGAVVYVCHSWTSQHVAEVFPSPLCAVVSHRAGPPHEQGRRGHTTGV